MCAFCQKPMARVSPGSVLATFLMMATTSGFSFRVNHFNNYNKIYGSLGAILILMFLIYLNSLILSIGFDLNLRIMFLKAISKEEKEEKQEKCVKVEARV